MKKKLNIEKIVLNIKKRKHFIIILLFIIFLFGMGFAAYAAIYPNENQTTFKKEQDKLEKMKVIFDQKILDELEQEQAPSVLEGSGGGNPFEPF